MNSNAKRFADIQCALRYCLGARDDWVRFAASSIVTASTLIIAFSLGNAVCAFRTHRLENGIPEGDFQALYL